MSSSAISFPRSPSPAHSSSTVTREDFFGSSYNSSSSFQINPLSPLPPRTPRTSIVGSQSYTYGDSSIYSSTVSQAEEPQERPEVQEYEDEEVAEDVEDVANESAIKKVKPLDVWREILKTTSGRDKAFKVLQYTLRVYLLFHNTLSSSGPFVSRKKTTWEVELVRRLDATASSLSTTRKALIMFNWLTPLTAILATRSDEFDYSEKKSTGKDLQKPLLHTFLHAPPPRLLEFVNGLSDDIHALSKMGLFGKRMGERAARFSDWCWFLATIAALIELGFERSVTKSRIKAVENRLLSEALANGTSKGKSAGMKLAEKELEKLQRQDFWLKVQRTKLLLDLLFVSYELFNIKPFRNAVKPFAGLGAALLSSARLFHNHRTSLVLKQT